MSLSDVRINQTKVRSMAIDKLVEAFNRIQDQKLRELLLKYRSNTDPVALFEILDYLNVKIIQDKLGAIIPNVQLDPFSEGIRIYLGGVIIDGELFTIEVVVYNDNEAYIGLDKSDDMLLYRQPIP